MGERIFVVDEMNGLRSLDEEPYDSEDLLQSLLARYPDLLTADGENRLVLVEREYSVPGEETGTGRWSLDHLFLDAEGVPTLVEVKRSSDTRVRREVVGQMLDYAANGVAWWPVDQIQAAFEHRCEHDGLDAKSELEDLLGPDGRVDRFWQQVKTNLQAGRVRMVFVADAIPPELRRIVEFLNQQMDPAEVLAVEVRQFVGAGLQTLIPRIIGKTVEAERRKTPRGSKPALTESELLGRVDDQQGREAVKRLMDLVRELGGIVFIGTSGASLRLPVEGRRTPVSVGWYIPPGPWRGWYGIEHLVAGYDSAASVSIEGDLRAILERYVERLSKLAAAEPFPSEGIRGFTFRTERLGGCVSDLEREVRRVHDELSRLGD